MYRIVKKAVRIRRAFMRVMCVNVQSIDAIGICAFNGDMPDEFQLVGIQILVGQVIGTVRGAWAGIPICCQYMFLRKAKCNSQL